MATDLNFDFRKNASWLQQEQEMKSNMQLLYREIYGLMMKIGSQANIVVFIFLLRYFSGLFLKFVLLPSTLPSSSSHIQDSGVSKE